ncbi:O-methyltransferase [Paenibacillus lautus]|uniref:O-methyltransferase n=1 Tax=Paenibacillus lautus TaxID=1401 RepID=UPI003D28AFB0
MTTTYRSNTFKPTFVTLSKDFAKKAGFTKSCTDDFGRLLYTLAGQEKKNILEIGTGFGVSTAWIISAMSKDAKLVTVDIDQSKVKSAIEILGRKNVEFLCGDWKDALKRGPFDLIFADVKDAKQDNAELLFESMSIGGLLILDDLTPEEYWPDDWKGKPDKIRNYWLNHPKLAASELFLNPREAVIIASRLSV